MGKNNNVLLLIAIIWMVCSVLSREILQRAVEMSLAISFLSDYLDKQFRPNSTQKMWLLRFRNFSMLAAGIFLILEIYYMFIA